MPTFKIRSEPRPREGRCRGCGASIVWVTTAAGKPMCLDRFVPIAWEPGLAIVSSDATHWATCPSSAQFARKRATA